MFTVITNYRKLFLSFIRNDFEMGSFWDFINYSKDKNENTEDSHKTLNSMEENPLNFDWDSISDLETIKSYMNKWVGSDEWLDSGEIKNLHKALNERKIDVKGEAMVWLKEALNEMLIKWIKCKNEKEYTSALNLLKRSGITIPTFHAAFNNIDNFTKINFKMLWTDKEDIIWITINKSDIYINYKYFMNSSESSRSVIPFDKKWRIIKNDKGLNKTRWDLYDKSSLDDNIRELKYYWQEYSEKRVTFNNLIKEISEINKEIWDKFILKASILKNFNKITLDEIKKANEEFSFNIPILEQYIKDLKLENEQEKEEVKREAEKLEIEEEIKNFIDKEFHFSTIEEVVEEKKNISKKIFTFNIWWNTNIDDSSLTNAFDEKIMNLRIMKKVETKLFNEPVVEEYTYENIVKIDEEKLSEELRLKEKNRLEKEREEKEKIRLEEVVKLEKARQEKINKLSKPKTIDQNIDARKYKNAESFYKRKWVNIDAESWTIITIQNALMKNWYDLPKYFNDGDFGKETFKALIQFQKDNYLAFDWQVGDDTLKTLWINKTSKEFYWI